VKIIDVTEFYSERGGGVRSHLTTRGHFLCQAGHEHVVMAPGPENVESVVYASAAPVGRSTLLQFAGPALPYDTTYHLLGRFDKIRTRLRAESPDVIEAHSPYLATGAVVAAGRGASRVRTAFWHADHIGTYLEPWLGSLSRPLFWAVRALLAPFDATFVGGLAQARKLRAVGVKNVEHVPFGVDGATFHPGARSATERRRLLGDAPPDAALLVGVGRFAFEKRWDVVIDALARVRERRPAVLVLFGDGPERSRLERRAPPGVHFAGFQTDRARLAAAMASADVLVHGCGRETFGLSVAEAVACGLPVVVPDAGGAAESADPSCGQLYASDDAHACATAILRLLARDPAELRTRAIEASGRVATAAGHIRQVLSVYDALLRATARIR
jgi:alpha-1,6-mannosyltransferase